MPRLPRVSGARVVSALKRAGFREVRTRGDHTFLINEETGCRTVVAACADPVPPGTLASILRQAGLTPEEFRDRLK